MEIDKIIIVTRLTRLEDNIKRFNTKGQAKFYIEKRGQSFADYELEYENYHRAKDLVVKSIPSSIRFQIIDRNFLPNFVFGKKDLILTLGQDGLVINVAKYLNSQNILAVNPDPERFDGVLLPFRENEVTQTIQKIEKNEFQTKKITMARVDLTDGQFLYACNDFFIGANSHISARYSLQFGEKTERHSSSGIIVSTPIGATGWLSSLFNMTEGINKFKKNSQSNSKKSSNKKTPNWEAKKLTFIVREPFVSKWSGADLVAGEITSQSELVIESLMPEKGVIFSDGMESDFLEFNSGSTAKVSIAEKVASLINK
ncbi:MAG: NAD+ kinase [Leptospiraceae bacterium]|nr:NAD(+)/NADH kinase [Leptospiraceae bacterium]MCK6379734.1 NAD+ kinase [Leptospiraceae bacterium]NUM41681.1 NAD(+)/NADH kinase [Leptospiraceae bacterium]